VKGRARLCHVKHDGSASATSGWKEPEYRGMKRGWEEGSYSDVKSSEPPRLFDHPRRGRPPKPKAEFRATTLRGKLLG
jgi:hypothetical protein